MKKILLRFLTITVTETSPEDLEALFAAARQAREKHFADKVFLYGFVYFSTYCKNDCAFFIAFPNSHLSP